MRPLDRRRAALTASLDEDHGAEWSPSAIAAFVDQARRATAARDRANVEAGRALLADYLRPGVTYRDAMRAYVDALLAPSRLYPSPDAQAAPDHHRRYPDAHADRP